MAHNQQELQAEFSAYAENRPKISTHCHQLPARELQGFDLDALLHNSYVNWCGVPWDAMPGSRQVFLEKVRLNSYFIWLQKSLGRLYGGIAPLAASNWQAWDERIRAAYRDPSHPRQVLTGTCGYRRMLLDAYWKPGSDNGAPDFFTPVYRVNAFFFGYSPSTRDHDGNNPYDLSPRPFISDLDEYVDWVYQSIRSHQASGCVALKIPIAYDRGLDFEPVSPDRARQAFARLAASSVGRIGNPTYGNSDRAIPSNAPAVGNQSEPADSADIKTFQDYLFFQICQMAAGLDLPIQIHTGMGQGRKTNAAQLQPAIQRFPQTRFALLHCSYPWIQDISMLADKYPHVNADLSFLPLISSRLSMIMLHELIERASPERIFWGCDTWTAEESFGALLAFCQVLSATLAEKVVDGYLSRADALQLMDNILLENPQRFYKLSSAGKIPAGGEPVEFPSSFTTQFNPKP